MSFLYDVEPKKPEKKKSDAPFMVVPMFLTISWFLGPLLILALLFFGWSAVFTCIAIFFVIAIIFVLVMYASTDYKQNQEQEEWYQKRYKAYQDSVVEAQKRSEEYAQNYENLFNEYLRQVEIEQKRFQLATQKNYRMRTYLQHELVDCNQKLQESTQRLQYLYGLNIIFPKYRNFAMVCSLDEYIRAGRCWTLEGPDGAYNILEAEMRMGIVITQLNYIITQLGQIQNNQYLLYSTLQETNRMLVEIVESNNQITSQLYSMDERMGEQTTSLNASINRLQRTSKATAYFAERSQRELRYMNFMNTFR